MSTERPFQALPKIDLHCHLDGSLRPQTVLELISELNLEMKNEGLNLEGVDALLVAPEDCDSLDTYLKRFDLPIKVMQSQAVIERVTFELFEDASRDGVRYLEVRFAPHLHTRSGLALEEVISSAIAGLRKAEMAYPIKGNIILSHLRHHSVKDMDLLVEAGRSFLGNGVVAVDLAGSEPLGFAGPFTQVVQRAKNLGYRITIHAGETGYGQNVVDAIELLQAERIGHGVAIHNHPQAYDLVKARGVVIEACPTSNVQTRAVTAISTHPIEEFYKDQLKVTLNTDNRTVSQIDSTGEYIKLHESFNWDIEQYKKIYLTSLEASFADERTRQWLIGFVEQFC